GGWESFNGFGRNYYAHTVGKLLVPVLMQESDDRVNASQGLLVRHQSSGQARTEPDWNKPPIICGYNAATAKEGAETLAAMQEIVADRSSLRTGEIRPLVVKGDYGSGVTIACLTDLAPHWSGGLTDWGEPVQLPNGVQVGDSYIKFVQFLLEA
ncbi:MAG TPA: glutamine amidotransferase, partial [Candidatus Saccharimonadales bacterium]